MAYQKPDWAQPPDQEWFLTEIKGGVQVAQHALAHSCTILGRAADQVHIPLQHESASRQHARIAFDSQGIPWLRDLGSTHGTTCNKRPLPALAIGKHESNATSKGARGIMLFPGDVLQFGASTRLFCVEGPEAFERGAFQAKQKQLILLSKQQHEQQQIQAEIMQEPEITTSDDEEEESSLSVDTKKTIAVDAEVPEKHRKTLERLNAMKHKLQNLELEDERIQRKGELSTGQERQLQRNAEREKALRESIVTLEAELYDKLHPTATGAKTTTTVQQVLEEEDEDDFFDRTKHAHHHKSIIQDGESEDTLIAKWKKIQSQQQKQTSLLQEAQLRVDQLLDKKVELEARGDDEEIFFLDNDLQLAQDGLNRLKKQEKTALENLDEIEKLLKIVSNSKLRMDRRSGYIGRGDPPDSTTTTRTDFPSNNNHHHNTDMLPPPSRSSPLIDMDPRPPLPISDKSIEGGFTMLLPPPKVRKAVPPFTEDNNSAPSSESSQILPEPAMPPPKRKRIVGPAMPPPTIGTAEAMPQADAASKSTSKNKPQGTLAFLSSMNNMHHPQEGPSDDGAKDSSMPSNSKTKTALDPKKDEWRAPEGQDGSGRTKLNAKFAGRY